MPAGTLPSLLGSVLGELDRAYARRGAGAGRMPSLDLWGNLLRAIDTAGVDPRNLPAALRLSKRAVRSRLAAAVRQGWIEETAAEAGCARIRLTKEASAAAARWPRLAETAERDWRAGGGAGRCDALRAAVEVLVGRLPLEHPHYPASYGAVDQSITGGNGTDWRPVFRARGDTVSGLSLVALISQALVAFSMDYEKTSPVPLALAASVMRQIPAAGEVRRKLANPVAVSTLVRHGFLRVRRDSGGEWIGLTAKGAAVKSAHPARIRAVEAEWRNRFGAQCVIALRQALLGVARPPAGGRQPAAKTRP